MLLQEPALLRNIILRAEACVVEPQRRGQVCNVWEEGEVTGPHWGLNIPVARVRVRVSGVVL